MRDHPVSEEKRFKRRGEERQPVMIILSRGFRLPWIDVAKILTQVKRCQLVLSRMVWNLCVGVADEKTCSVSSLEMRK